MDNYVSYELSVAAPGFCAGVRGNFLIF
jgi:hypothetical protein